MNTITPSPIAVFKSQTGARTWNLLVRHGLDDLTLIRQALADGLAPGDYKGLGQIALLEIRLALDSLPADETPPALPALPALPESAVAPALSGRELTLLLALAEAGMDRLDPRISVNEASSALGHLRQLAGEDEIGDLYPAADPAEIAFPPTPVNPPALIPQPHPGDGPPRAPENWPPRRREPDPVDDDFEGYVIDPKPGWGQF
jgi:hypothetical protein